MIHVLATIELQPGCREEFLVHFRALVPSVRAESGCLEYGPAVDQPTGLNNQLAERPDVVVVIEKWESLEHLQAHLVAPHMLEYRAVVKPLVRGSQLQVLRPA